MHVFHNCRAALCLIDTILVSSEAVKLPQGCRKFFLYCSDGSVSIPFTDHSLKF